MTWRTQYGDRVLQPREAVLFAESLLSLIDGCFLNEYDDYLLGIKAFDNLTFGQQLSALATVAKGLLCEDVPVVPLTAVLEAAIAAVFEHMRNLLIIEIDEPDLGTARREMVVAARQEAGGEEIPPADCSDIKEWDFEIECLSEAILWDADYDDEGLYADRCPDEARELRSMAGISEEYYAYIPDDIKDDDIEVRRNELRKLCCSVLRQR